MSIVLVVKVSEGLVLGADSAATISGRIERPEGVQEGVLKTYFNARKLLQIGDFPIGVVTWGQSFIGARTIESLVREWEHKENWQSQEEYHKEYEESEEKLFSVRKCAESLRGYLDEVYDEEFGHLEKQPPIGLVVAGYSELEFFPEIWRFVLPFDDQVYNQRPNRDDNKPDFGATWFGLVEPLVRLHWGRDEAALNIISEKFDIPQQDIHEALLPLQYQIPFPVMPLQDAIEYAHYMLNVAVGRYRFVIGPELCGGQIEIAAITQGKFHWISRKTWSLEGKEGDK